MLLFYGSGGVWSKFHTLRCCGSENFQTCVHFWPYFCKEALQVFSTTCASVPVEIGHLVFHEIPVVKNKKQALEPLGTRLEVGGTGRHWAKLSGTGWNRAEPGGRRGKKGEEGVKQRVGKGWERGEKEVGKGEKNRGKKEGKRVDEG